MLDEKLSSEDVVMFKVSRYTKEYSGGARVPQYVDVLTLSFTASIYTTSGFHILFNISTHSVKFDTINDYVINHNRS